MGHSRSFEPSYRKIRNHRTYFNTDQVAESYDKGNAIARISNTKKTYAYVQKVQRGNCNFG